MQARGGAFLSLFALTLFGFAPDQPYPAPTQAHHSSSSSDCARSLGHWPGKQILGKQVLGRGRSGPWPLAWSRARMHKSDCDSTVSSRAALPSPRASTASQLAKSQASPPKSGSPSSSYSSLVGQRLTQTTLEKHGSWP